MPRFITVFKRAIRDFLDDDCMSSGASIAYYTIFSLPPLLVIVVYAASAMGYSQTQVSALMKKQMGIPVQRQLVQDKTTSSDKTQKRDQEPMIVRGIDPILKLVGGFVLFFTVTSVFAQFQYALNRTWHVEPDPDASGAWVFVRKRFLSFAMILVLLFLLLVSLVLTTFIDEIVAYIQHATIDSAAAVFAVVLNNIVSAAVATVLFAAMFKFMPDAKIGWRGVWTGALATAVLFIMGKAAMGWYLDRANFESAWGSAAASMIAILVWVYYNSLLVLFGAEFTQEWAASYYGGVEPAEGAVRVARVKKRIAKT